MSDRKAKLNPTLALALQARPAGQPASKQQDEHNRSAGIHSAAHFRRLARSGKDAFSTGIPTVCTIH
jgi:hypothetical protein